ncbi:MAG TPA: acyl carrier protein [Pirellulales bacterium]|nr:acyl carrier protein [Pirellulales bacterium]
MSDTVEYRTRKLVAEIFGLPIEAVTPSSSHETIEEWDSLNLLNILMSIEGEFGVSVSPEEAAEFVSVERILGVLRSKGVS